jgi:hypothetical protein
LLANPDSDVFVGGSLIVERLLYIEALINDCIVEDIRVFLILNFEVVAGELLYGQVSGELTILRDDEGSLSNPIGHDALHIGLTGIKHDNC